jgi:magnesium chelatase subunit D
VATLDRVRTLLGCLAAEPRLGGVLFHDLDPFLLAPLARLVTDALPGSPATVVLGPGSGDEGLWVRMRPDGDALRLVPGPLAAADGAVVLVPDLGQADPAVTRIAVTLAGADAAAVEMRGYSRRWRPRTWWLAAAPRGEVANMSPHLLDRFPIRVEAGRLLAEWTGAAGAVERTTRAEEEAALLRAVPPLDAAPDGPPLTGDALRRVVELLPPGPSRRRDLALARIARMAAGSAGAAETGAAHVDEAAGLLGIAAARDGSGGPPVPDVPPPGPGPVASRHPRPEPPAARARPETAPPGTGRPVPARTGDLVLLPDAATACPWPYPEDDPAALPRLGALRPPSGRRTRAGRLRGRPLGVRPASSPRDIAIVATVVEAAKFQAVRRAHRPAAPPGLLISPADLRRPRRAAEPGAALVLVLDHSCWRHWDRGPGLAAFLRAAHRDDAAVTMIEFGHRDTPEELTAVRYRARTLLDPRVPVSLRRAPGRATPLAHGLDLAVAELRRLLRRGPVPVSLVVATDGRGNVPLDDSLLGEVRGPVGGRGVRDALRAAAPMRSLPGVRAVVLAPDEGRYGRLPFDLADAMGGSVIVAPRREGGT